LRGKRRADRMASYAQRSAVVRQVTSESLARKRDWQQQTLSNIYPLIKTLDQLAKALDRAELKWGPTGGVGFFLASGIPVLRCDSDLDLVLYAEDRLTHHQTTALREAFQATPWRIDAQIDTGVGGFSFSEW